MENEKVIHNLEPKSLGQSLSFKQFFSVLIIVLIAALGLGFVVSKFKNGSTLTGQAGTSQTKATSVAGVPDKSTFKDQAEGVLQTGGVDGEGSFHLDRPGGQSQNVYLTSTTVDLSKYVGKKVRVWGQTYQGDKAGWLMDVGLVEILQ